MPDGITHDNLWTAGRVFIALPVATVSLISINPLFSAGTVVGYWLGKYITPDMDLVGVTHNEGMMMRNLGIVGGLLVSYWTFYGFLFRGLHRHWLTHGLFISTFIRFGYMFWWMWWFGFFHNIWLSQLMLGVYYGMSSADAIHIVADKIIKDKK